MLTGFLNNPLSMLFYLIALVVAITVHEYAHAYTADRLGDPTPSLQGRLTLNPLAHLDPLGTLMLLLVRFGWGKPVQFDPYNLRHPRRDAAIISFAGPVSNLIVATLGSVLLHILNLTMFPGTLVYITLYSLITPVVIMNIVLAVFNLIPIHPLDGFKIVGGFLPAGYARQWYELEPYGMIFLFFMLFPVFGGTAPISRLISPVINMLLTLLLPSQIII